MILRKTAADWLEDNAPQHGAALAFYSILSLAPVLIIAVSIAGAVFGEKAARGELDTQIAGLVGKEEADSIQEMLANTQKHGQGVLAASLGLVTLLIGASGVFGQLQSSLNTIWEVRPKSGRGIWGFVQDRFLSFAMVLGIGFLLLISLVLSALLAGIGNFLGALLPGWTWFLHVANFGISFLVITLLFAMIYKILPDVKIAWKDVWAGASLTALLFIIGKFAIGQYLGYASIGSSYGAAGSLVVLVLWVYYSSQILLFGAEFTQVYAQHSGSPLIPTSNAETFDSHRPGHRNSASAT